MAKGPNNLKNVQTRKIQPKLRMYCNADTNVNRIRAEYSSSISMKPGFNPDAHPIIRQVQTRNMAFSELSDTLELKDIEEAPKDVLTNIFVKLDSDSRRIKIPGETGRRGNLVSATVPLSQMKKLSEEQGVSYIEMGERLTPPNPIISPTTDTPLVPSRPQFGPEELHTAEKKVLIGIIDCQGFDFSHPDFRDSSGGTRFYKIWDQGGDARPGPTGSHDTHVASLAAGNSGIRPIFYIAGV